MSENLALAKTLAHHDAAISGLGSRMTGVEAGLNHVNEKVSTLDSRVAQGFGEVLSQIRESKAAQGPGFSDSIRMTVGMVTLGAAAVAAVTFMVSSFVEPKLQKLTDVTEKLDRNFERDQDAKQREYEKLKELRREEIDSKLEKLSEQASQLPSGWGTVVIEKGSKK
jgi:CII-binding regulator of phage lambda lysogenization HflD